MTPVYKAPTGTAGSCSSSDISSFWTDCFGTDAFDECNTAGNSPVSTACFECLVANSPSNSTWGVMILDKDIWELNQGGCYVAQSASQQVCAQAIEYQQQCENTECASYVSGSSATPFDNCVTTADTGSCACYVTAATSACSSYTSSTCNFSSSASLETAFKAVAQVMCE